jgi:NEDD8-activating enzyme E1 regulatory subunit
LSDKLLSHIAPDGSISVSEKYLKEVLRFADSKLHTVGAFLGGVASQEAIKLIIKQYTPLNHTLLYDGIHGKTFSC